LAKHRRPSPAAPLQCGRRGEQTRRMGTPALFGITREAPSQGPRRSKRSGHTQAILQLPGCTPSIRSHPKPGLASASRKLYRPALYVPRHVLAPNRAGRQVTISVRRLDITEAPAPTRAHWRRAHKRELYTTLQAPGVAHASASRPGRCCAHAQGRSGEPPWARSLACAARPLLQRRRQQRHEPRTHRRCPPKRAREPSLRAAVCAARFQRAAPTRHARPGSQLIQHAGMYHSFTGPARRGRGGAARPLRRRRCARHGL